MLAAARRPLRTATTAALLVTALLAAQLALAGRPARAVEVPPGASFDIQTNGPNAAVGLGDWYTATSAGAGAGQHYAGINIPCGWPAGTPVHVDLFSPEMNLVAGALGQHEEPTGSYDSTQFELYPPGTGVGPGYDRPAPGGGIPGTRVTFRPAAAGVLEHWVRLATLSPVTCGTYVLRSEVLASDPLNPTGEGNDQNGWRLRVGSDDDADPDTAPPSDYDNPDGVTGTGDELSVGLYQITYQHDQGGRPARPSTSTSTPASPRSPSTTSTSTATAGSATTRRRPRSTPAA